MPNFMPMLFSLFTLHQQDKTSVGRATLQIMYEPSNVLTDDIVFQWLPNQQISFLTRLIHLKFRTQHRIGPITYSSLVGFTQWPGQQVTPTTLARLTLTT